ncbi:MULTISPECIES: hypothetical protein [Nostocaceae]|nr:MULTISPECIES: hypothetical protein [Nostocaceae]
MSVTVSQWNFTGLDARAIAHFKIQLTGDRYPKDCQSLSNSLSL